MDWVASSHRVDWEGTIEVDFEDKRDSASERRDDMNSVPMKLSIVQIELGLEGSRVICAVFIWDAMWAIRPSGENRLLVLLLMLILISLALALALGLALGVAGFCFCFLFPFVFVLDDDEPPNPPAVNAVSGRIRNGDDADDAMSASNMYVRDVRMRCEQIILTSF